MTGNRVTVSSLWWCGILNDIPDLQTGAIFPAGIFQELKEAMRDASPEVLESIDHRAAFPNLLGGMQHQGGMR